MDRNEALVKAAAAGNERLVRGLIEEGADPMTKDCNGRIPLSFAAKNGHEAIVRFLLEGRDRGPKFLPPFLNIVWAPYSYAVNSQDNCGRTPLSFAAENGHVAIMMLLLVKGANLGSEDHDGRTPLSLAAENGQEAIVRLLLCKEPKGAKIGNTYGTLFMREFNALFSRDKRGQTPLSFAAKNGHETIVRLLLERGAKVCSRDYDGRTPLLFAAERGHNAIVRLLLEKGSKANSKDNFGRTPLMVAAQNRYKAILKLLLRYLNNKYGLYEMWQLIILIFNCFYSVFFFEWPDGQRLLSTTMPWNIPPSLLVLWGVCWMFAPYGQEMHEMTGTEAGIMDIALFPGQYILNLVFRIRFMVIS